MEGKRILVVDDDPAARYAARRAIEASGRATEEADSGERCLEVIASRAESIATILLDMSMPGMGGKKCLAELTRLGLRSPVVMMTAYGSERLAVECLRKGAYDYLPKPYEADELVAVVARAVDRYELATENQRLRTAVEGAAPIVLGTSVAMLELSRLVERVAPTDVSVLITGESGTGKEVVAREIQRRSGRATGPFITLNCAALPEELVESELFGHERGAFTGAVDARKGKFERADRGTLFLDEVGEMTSRTQSKLLRVLQEGAFERVGGNRPMTVDVRVLAASNRELRAEVAAGRFREDLYYRLKVAELRLPPLRDRTEDIPILAKRFLGAAGARLGREFSGFSNEALQVLEAARWPGNVRELKNAVEYAAVMSDHGWIQVEALPREIGGSGGGGDVGIEGDDADLGALAFSDARRLAIQRFEKSYLTRRLSATHGNVSETARLMGIARQSLQAKLKELRIDPAPFRVRQGPPLERKAGD